MKISYKEIYLFPILFALIILPINIRAADNVVTVEVWGEALIQDRDRPRARERALQEAFSAAITQVMGAFITAESFTRNYVSIERSVLGRTKGYVKTYQILQELTDGDFLRLLVIVTVSKEEIKDDLTALGILLDAMGNPVISLRGKEKRGWKTRSPHGHSKKSYHRRDFRSERGKQIREPMFWWI